MKRLAVMASGNGTNLQAIIDATESGTLPDCQVVVVVSNRKHAYALERAQKYGIPTICRTLKSYEKAGKSRHEYDIDLADAIAAYSVDLVVLAGWMHLFCQDFLDRFSDNIVNIHPALPGMFPGTHAIERAYAAYGEEKIHETGVMVHFVPDEGVDSGPIICQRAVPILPNDTLTDLEEKIHSVEHVLYIEAIAKVLNLG